MCEEEVRWFGEWIVLVLWCEVVIVGMLGGGNLRVVVEDVDVVRDFWDGVGSGESV